MAAHTAVGYLLAVGVVGAVHGERLAPAVLGLVLWVACLNGGTLALNSAFDRDEGDIAYLRNPPPPPAGLAAFALALMAVGQGVSFALPPGYRVAYAACFVLSVLYSVPPFRLKAVAGADWLINMIGFGTLTPLAGWASTGRPLGPGGAIVVLAFCPLFAGLYPLTQLYQIEEDTRRGDRTLARILGVRRSLEIALVAVAAAFALFTWGALRTGWPSQETAWRWILLGLALLAWLTVLLPWRAGAPGWSSAQHQRGMYRALAAWAVTDLAVVLAWAT
jgi:4-hydroxybenzoate polyprenyltransferase